MNKEEKAEAIRSIFSDLDAKGMLRAVPNSVYWDVSVKDSTVHDHLFDVYLDIGLADQYGKHSPQSKHAMYSFQCPFVEEGLVEALNNFMCDGVKGLTDLVLGRG